jgi:ubiquinone/menaquinone biosynthesis C-methylase UbiE
MTEPKAQNIYDNPEFFTGYAQLNRSKLGLKGAPEWESVRQLIPEITIQSSRVLDLGCGYGWFSRWALEQNAASVLGIDISKKMIAKAKSMSQAGENEKIEYETSNLEELKVKGASFDLVYSSMTFHYIVNLEKLLATIFKALVPGGSLVFTVEHPIYSAGTNPNWIEGENGQKMWPVYNYQKEGPRLSNWFVSGVLKQHRTIGTYVNRIIAAGFTLTHLEEFGPSAEQIRQSPELEIETERPMILIISARR